MEQEKITIELNRNLVIGFSIGLIVGYLISNWRRTSANPPYYSPMNYNWNPPRPSFTPLSIRETRVEDRSRTRRKADIFSSDNPYTEYEI